MTHTDWYILLLSALPVTELRATLPLAVGMGLDPLRAFSLAVIGNLLPIVPILVFLEPVSKLLRYIPVIDRAFQKILEKSRSKGKQAEKYGVWGLMLFVAIPLPGTGAWTGAILAWLLGFNVFCSAAAIGAGVILAGIIVILVTMGVLKAALVYNLEVLLAAVLICGVIYGLWRWRRQK